MISGLEKVDDKTHIEERKKCILHYFLGGLKPNANELRKIFNFSEPML